MTTLTGARIADTVEIIARKDATIRHLKRKLAEMRKVLAVVIEQIPTDEDLDWLDDDERTGRRRLDLRFTIAELRAFSRPKPPKANPKTKLSERLASYDKGRKQGPPPLTREERDDLDALGEPPKNPANRTNSGRKRGVSPAKRTRKR